MALPPQFVKGQKPSFGGKPSSNTPPQFTKGKKPNFGGPPKGPSGVQASAARKVAGVKSVKAPVMVTK